MLSKMRAHGCLVLGVQLQVVLPKRAELQLAMGKLTTCSKVTFARMLIFLADSNFILWTCNVLHLLTVVVVDLLAGHTSPHVNLPHLSIPMSILAD